MNKTTLITIFILLVIAIAAVVLFKTTAPASAPGISPEASSAVIGSPQGFVQFAPSETPPFVSPVPTSSPQAAAVISIMDTGFEPSAITVTAGTTVTFVNNGQAAHWPASDPHPTHTALPGFDAKRALATGETYSFVFSKVGQWGFHDHLHSQLHGTVTVQ